VEININSVFEELKNREILTQKNVSDIKNYISVRYPNHSPQKKAAIFADAVNKIINKNISSISITYRDGIRKTLLRETVKKTPFAINANDVYHACVNSGFKEDNFINEVSQWCGNILENPHIKDAVKDYTLKLISLAETPSTIDDTVNNSINDTKCEPLSHDRDTELLPENVSGQDVKMPDAEVIEEISVSDDTPVESEYVSSIELDAASNIPDTGSTLGTHETGSIKSVPGIKKIVIAASALVLIITFFSVALSGKLKKTAGTVQPSAPEATPSPSYVSIFNSLNTPDDLYLKKAILSNLGYSMGIHRNVPKHKKVMYLTATAYDLSYESCGKTRDHPEYGITYTGTRAKLGRTVAVDPSVIPLGSEMYIIFPEEYSHLNGVYIAEDTGSLIKGNKIDIFFGEDKPSESIVNESAMKFGVRKVYVYILN